MEADPARTQPSRPVPPLPPNYVTLAQLQERRRLKLELQREEEEAAARLQKQKEEEEDQERLPRLKEVGEEREGARRPGGGGTAPDPARRGGRRGLSRWRHKKDRGGDGVPGADPKATSKNRGPGTLLGGGDLHEDGKKDGGPRGGRGRAAGGRRRWNRSRSATDSGCAESGSEGARVSAAAVAAAAIGGPGDPRDQGEAKCREEVKPRSVDVEEEEEGTKAQPDWGAGASVLELKEKQGNVDLLAQPCRGQDGAKVIRNGFQSRARSANRRAKYSNPLGPSGTVDVAWKLKDLSIAMPEGDKAGVGGGDGGDRGLWRSPVGRRGAYPSFRGPRRSSMPATGNGMMWVRKSESS